MDLRDLYSVLDALLDGVILLDSDGHVVLVNAEACRIHVIRSPFDRSLELVLPPEKTQAVGRGGQ